MGTIRGMVAPTSSASSVTQARGVVGVAGFEAPHGVPPEPSEPTDPEGPAFSRPLMVAFGVGTVVALLASLVLRFWTRSHLWLDEALTVDISAHPLRQLPGLLRQDGAPPLFYALLHFWNGWFGTSAGAARALSGVIGVITVPLAWLAGRRLGGRTVAWGAFLLVATSPFAVRYDTEVRMYSLVALETVLGFLALDRALSRPRLGNLTAMAAVTAALLYTHYWSVYLLAMVTAWLLFQAWRGRRAWRSGAIRSLGAMVVGGITFLPWVPTFLFQSSHTGTPWATPASFAAMVNAVGSFAGGSTSQGRALGLAFFALSGLALFGVATDRLHISLDIRTRHRGRPLAVIVAGTLALAVIGGLVTTSAFDARYASVVFIPLILLVSLGLVVFQDRHVRAGVLAACVVLGLAAAVPNVWTDRTQAGQVADAIMQSGQPGDVVAYCPDQLGPAVQRLLPPGEFKQVTFPRAESPDVINWIDYAAAVRASSPLAFSQRLEALAAGGHQIFVVWAPGYQAFGVRCEGVVQSLQGAPGYHATGLVVGESHIYQPMWLVRLSPIGT